jgi:hypothetical protein
VYWSAGASVPALRTYYDLVPENHLRPFSIAWNGFGRFIWMGNRVRTIAVVEDDPSMLQGLNRLLSAHGFRVERFTSAEAFLGNIAKCEAKCLVVDIHLRGITGIRRNVEHDVAEVSVSDSGKSITEANLTNIFDAFVTTKPPGTGLGLPVARAIGESYRGTIWAENRHRGAMFSFTIPLARARAG